MTSFREHNFGLHASERVVEDIESETQHRGFGEAVASETSCYSTAPCFRIYGWTFAVISESRVQARATPGEIRLYQEKHEAIREGLKILHNDGYLPGFVHCADSFTLPSFSVHQSDRIPDALVHVHNRYIYTHMYIVSIYIYTHGKGQNTPTTKGIAEA